MYEHDDDDAITIGVYDDHAASAGSDELEYAYLCGGCAAERNGDVTRLSAVASGDWACCDDCGIRNRTEEEEDY